MFFDYLRPWLAVAMASMGLVGAHAESLTALHNPVCNKPITEPGCVYEWGNVQGTTRHGMVCRPSDSNGAPLVLVFHGHGGCAQSMAQSTEIHKQWPQAMVVYLDGLPGVATPNDPQGTQTGWQLYPDTFDNRDVQLVDAVIDYFHATAGIDTNRVHAIGHSNGSRFVGVLWATRSARLRSLVFNAAQAGDLLSRYASTMAPRAVALTMGRQDCVVPFNAALNCPTPVARSENYQEASINLVRTQLGVAAGATPTGRVSERGTAGKELGIYVHDGEHIWPFDETWLAVRFMQRN